MTKEAIEFVCKAASDYVTEPGFLGNPTTLNPMCLTRYNWDGVWEADFWSHQPEIERMLDSPEEEENPDVEDQESVHTIDSD
ncbi:unnamed protein product [Aphanomyces euteiches]